MTVIDRKLGNGSGNLAVNALVASEQLKHGLGVDIPGLLRGLAAHETPRFGTSPGGLGILIG